MKARGPVTTVVAPVRRRAGEQANLSPGSRIDVPEHWEWHYRILQGLRERLLKNRDDQLTEATAPVDSHSSHMGDSGSDEFDHDRALGLLAQEQDMNFEVEAAIRRILDGSYGICEETGAAIPAARLRAVPWTRYAKHVEERLERQGLAGNPPPTKGIAFHSVPHGPRARDDELDIGEEPLEEDEIGEEPQLVPLGVSRGQREDVIEALENGTANDTEGGIEPRKRGTSEEEPITGGET